jgi:dTDP-4-amino-4,6-dideoxygalactose transaminase
MITKEAKEKESYIRRMHFTSSAREGCFHLLNNLQFQEGEKILLPSYIGITDKEGSGVFDPIIESGIAFDFYKLNKNLSIDMEDFERKLSKGGYRVALVIHYFGFLQNDIDLVVNICKEYGAYLLEDCAHTFSSRFNGKLLGEFGDFSFNSIHKIIATQDGGILRINNGQIKLPEIGDNEKVKMETLEYLYKTDMELVSRARVRNYRYLLNSLKGQGLSQIEIMYPVLNEGIVPLNFPIIVKNGNREELYFQLIDNGVITTSLYYRMIKSINPKEFPISYQISNSILNLPIHQDITLSDLDIIASVLKKINTGLELGMSDA